MNTNLGSLTRRQWGYGLIAALLVLGIVALVWFSNSTKVLRLALPMNTPEEPMATPDSANWPGSAGWPGSAYLAVKFGREQDRTAHIQPGFRIAGKGAVASLQDGTVDAAWTFSPPVVNAIAAELDLIVVAVVMRSYGQARLFARAERVDNWYLGHLAVTEGTILDSLVFAQLREMGKLNHLRDGSLTLINTLNPENTFFVLINEQVDAASMPGLYGDFIESLQTGKNRSDLVDVSIPDVYLPTGMIVMTPDSFARHRDTTLELLRIYRDYGEYVAANPAKALSEMLALEAAGASATIDLSGRSTWQPEDFLVLTDKEEIRDILEYEAQIRIDGGALNGMPDFEPALAQLDYITAELAKR